MIQTHQNQKIPQKDVKRGAILTAAAEVFLDVGFGAASMDIISQKAGVSKATVYSHFGNKEKLFGAIIETQCHDLLTSLQDTEALSNDIELTLRKTANHFMGVIMSEPTLSLYRVVIAEAVRFPKLAQVFYDIGPKQAVENFAHYLSEQTERGQFNITDPRRAAEQFLSLLSGHMHMMALLGIKSRQNDTDMTKHINGAVKTFLRIYKPSS